MLRRRFGRTEIPMPVFSCGGMRYQKSWKADAPIDDKSQAHLEATIGRALSVGINHIETARGYGTSERQLGKALRRHNRDGIVLQTKVAPKDDPAVFEAQLEASFERLQVSRIDLFAFHGLNDPQSIDETLRPGGCYEVADRMRRQGRIGHLGFSTHAPRRLIVQAIETDRFDYVNLHYYYIFQDNWPAIEAARRRDMGVFIISPSDKGGRLYKAPDKLHELCAPLSPMLANDLFCLSHPEIHTLSLGAARPSDFDEHLGVLPLLRDADVHLAPILQHLEAAYLRALGSDFGRHWQQGLLDWDQMPGGLNIRYILWLRNLALAYDLHDFARERYSNLTGHDRWIPGANAKSFDENAVLQALALSPFQKDLPGLLREAHALLYDPAATSVP